MLESRRAQKELCLSRRLQADRSIAAAAAGCGRGVEAAGRAPGDKFPVAERSAEVFSSSFHCVFLVSILGSQVFGGLKNRTLRDCVEDRSSR